MAVDSAKASIYASRDNKIVARQESWEREWNFMFGDVFSWKQNTSGAVLKAERGQLARELCAVVMSNVGGPRTFC